MKLLGIGIDLCKISRIQHILDGPASTRFLARTMHPDELKEEITPQFVASRWAVKEAFIKAAGQSLIPNEIKVMKDSLGRPSLSWTGLTQTRLSALGNVQAMVSLSHEVEYAVGVVVVFLV
jgi:holo-[acyl-carrier protein] synthase